MKPLRYLVSGCRAGSRGAGAPPPPPPPPYPENQFENVKGKGRTISLFLHQKYFIVSSSGPKEPQNCNFQPHLMLVDANCDDSVTIPRCPNLVVDFKVSVALKIIFTHLHAHFVHSPIPNPGSTPVRLGQ